MTVDRKLAIDVLRITVWAVVLASVACGPSVPVLVFRSCETPPKRDARSAYDKGERRHFSFWAYGQGSQEDAYAVAYDNVVSHQIPSEISVQVEGSTLLVEKDVNGEYSYVMKRTGRTSCRRIVLEEVVVEEHYEECFQQSGNMSCNAFVRASIPRRRMALARRMMRDVTVLLLLCDPASVCAGPVEDRLRSAATGAGILLADATETVDSSVQDLGNRHDAAQVLKVQLAAKYEGSEGKPHFATASGSVGLVDTSSGKVVSQAASGVRKAGDLTREGALDRAIKDAAERLANDIEYGTLGGDQ